MNQTINIKWKLVVQKCVVLLYLATHVCNSAECCGSTGGPAQPRWSSSAHPVFCLWWPWSGLPSLSRTRAPGWCKDTGCPPAPSLWTDTTWETPPPTPRAEATSCVDRKQEGSKRRGECGNVRSPVCLMWLCRRCATSVWLLCCSTSRISHAGLRIIGI